MGKDFKRLHIFFRGLVFIGCTVFFLNGCSTISTCTVVCLDARVKQGRQACFNEDYSRSRKIFSRLALEESDERLQAAGLYGNACLDMILAKNAPDFRKALEQLLLIPSQLSCRDSTPGDKEESAGRKTVNNSWSRMHPGMLEKALAHGMVLLESERSGILKKLDDLYARQKMYKKERASMQKKFDSIEPEITALKKQNIDQEARITDLLHQITVLEKIDKERQEQRENK